MQGRVLVYLRKSKRRQGMNMAIMEPYEPINTLKPVSGDVWIVDGPITHFRYFGTQVPFITLPFPTRMTIVRLANGDLWIHSPTALTPELKSEIEALGPVRHLIAPNKIHFWWVPEWKKAFPDAKAYAARWVRNRAGERGGAFDLDLTADPDPSWADEMNQTAVPGSYMTEIVFMHRRSRTLILADLIQNYEAAKIHNALYRCILASVGTLHPDGKTPADLRLSFRPRRREVQEAVQAMIGWGPERIIIAHGRWYKSNAVAELQRAFRWLGPLDKAGASASDGADRYERSDREGRAP